LESYRWSENYYKEYRNFIKEGIWFVVTLDDDGNHVFSPSRFLGYVNNTYEKHIGFGEKYGGETNEAIFIVIGKEPEEKENL
jgi:hypothetical protein